MSDPRRALLAKVHIGKKSLGLDDDTYRALLQRAVGVDSAGSMSVHQLELVLGAMRRAGWKDTPTKRQSSPLARKIEVMWAELARVGGLRTDDLGASLRAFVRRQTGVEQLAWLGPEDATKVLEAVKAMLARARRGPTGAA